MNTSDKYIQVKEGELGWTDYVWADGLTGAKGTYRRVRQVYRPVGTDGFFKQVKVLKSWKDGKLQ